MRFDSSDHYDVTPDGQRFVINTALADEGTEPMAVVIGWDAELR